MKNNKLEFETIKRNYKPKIVIGVGVLLILTSVVMFVGTRAKYRSVQSIKLASGTVKLNQYDFKIVAMYQQKEDVDCTEDSCYDTLTGRMPSMGYIINEEKSYCSIDGKNRDTEAVLKTIDGHHVVENLVKNEKCYIWFDKVLSITNSTELIASFEEYNGYKGEEIPDFATIATGTETEDNNGIYKVADGMYNGYSYYWRGVATTNHIIFDSKCWRIVRINGDGSIRLIYNGTPSENTCTQEANSTSVIIGSSNEEKRFSTSDGKFNNSSYVGWTYILGEQRTTSGTASNAKTQTEKWYNNNISAIAKTKVDSAGKFCNDRNVDNPPSKWNWSGHTTTWSATGTKFVYAGVDRLWNKYTPTLSCPNGDVYSLKVGAITADEVEFAGGKDESNTSYYLYTSTAYWTMSPCHWDYGASMLIVNYDGTIDRNGVNNTNYGLRPVINLRSDVTFNAGSDGTQNNPYIVQ